MDPDQIKAAIEAIKNQDQAAALQILEALLASAAGAPSTAPPPPGGDDPSAQGADSPPVVTAALTQLRKLTSRVSMGEVVAEVTAWSEARNIARTEALALEQTSRVELTAELVKLGYELPATAWEGDPKDRKPAKHIAAMSVADLRARVVALRAAPRSPETPKPPVGGPNGETVTVTQSDRDGAKKLGITVQEFQERKKSIVRRV